jgi:PKD repeat protein
VSRRATMRRAGLFIVTLLGLVAWSNLPALASLPNTSNPTLNLDRTIRTTPFVGTSVSMKDGEGSAYVGPDDSLWLADDNGRSIFEVNPSTGALKRQINRTAFEAAPKFGGGAAAGPNRSADFEAMAYDETNDTLYVFSGNCCNSTVLPTAFRLLRVSGQFQVESYQPLASGSDFTAASWNPADHAVWVGKGRDLRTYNYATNSTGPIVRVANLTGILGLRFSDDGADLYAVTNQETLVRVNWATKTIVPGWTFNLQPSGVRDGRAVELIADHFYVLDGYDGRSSGDPLKHAVFVYSVTGPGPTAPTAHFTASPTSGTAPLTVNFADTSTGDPTPSPSWDFGDGSPPDSSSTPSHTYTSPGTYTVVLTATSTAGSDTEQATITVSDVPPPPTNLIGNPGFETDTSGWGTATSGSSVTLTRTTPGRDGSSGAALVANGGSTFQRCALNDQPNWVPTTSAGPYTASIWVRGDVAGAVFRLVLKEFNGTTEIGSKSVERPLSTDWQLFTVSLTPTAPGTSTLDFWGLVPPAYGAPGTCFVADDASLVKS